MELLVGTQEIPRFARRAPFLFGQEGDVQRRGLQFFTATRPAASSAVRASSLPVSSRRPVAGVNGTLAWSLG